MEIYTSIRIEKLDAYNGVWGRLDLNGNEIGEPFPANNVYHYGTMSPKINDIYKQFIEWKDKLPHEIDIWIGDCQLPEELLIDSQIMLKWHEWKERRNIEDSFINANISWKDKARYLIDIDAINNAYYQFLMEDHIERIIKIASISNIYTEINCSIDIKELRIKYSTIYNRLLKDSIKIYILIQKHTNPV